MVTLLSSSLPDNLFMNVSKITLSGDSATATVHVTVTVGVRVHILFESSCMHLRTRCEAARVNMRQEINVGVYVTHQLRNLSSFSVFV